MTKPKRFALREHLWKRKFGYKPEPNTVDVGWTTVKTHGVIAVPVDILLPSVCTKNGNIRVPLRQTAHYHWIRDIVDENDDSASREEYKKYIEEFHLEHIYPQKSLEQRLNHVVEMVSSYKSDAEKSRSITIITGAPTRKFRVCPYAVKIYDGVHRAAIAMALGNTFIRCLVK